MNLNLKNNNGSITLFVLLSSLFFLVLVTSTTVYLKNKSVAQDEQYQQTKQKYADYMPYGEVTIPKRSPRMAKTVSNLNIGDYVDYKPDKSAVYPKDKLSASITGSDKNTSDILTDNLGWRILKFYDDGSVDLIGDVSSKNIYFKGAIGYNNGVYVLNDLCKNLYSNSAKNIVARSVNLNDMALSSNGENVRNLYSNIVKFGENKNYSGDIVNCPDIIGKASTESDNYYQMPTSNTFSNVSNFEAKQTYYEIDINEANYDNLTDVLNTDTGYLIATRYVNCENDYARFGIFRSKFDKNISDLFFTNGKEHDNFNVGDTTQVSDGLRIRPVVHLENNIKIQKCNGENSKTNMHTILDN